MVLFLAREVMIIDFILEERCVDTVELGAFKLLFEAYSRTMYTLFSINKISVIDVVSN